MYIYIFSLLRTLKIVLGLTEKKIKLRLKNSSEMTEANTKEEENISIKDAQKELKVIVISIISIICNDVQHYCTILKSTQFIVQLLSNTFSQIIDRTNLYIYLRLRFLLQKTAMERIECSQLPSYFLVQEGVSRVITLIT